MGVLDSIIKRISGTSGAAPTTRDSKFAMPMLEPGKRLMLDVKAQDTPEGKLQFSTTFEGFDDNGHLIVAAPMHSGSVYEIPEGRRCSASYFAEGDIYLFDCRARPHDSEGALRFIRLERVSAVEKIERREDFRLSVSLPCRILRVATGGDDQTDEMIHDAKVLDISGGGVRVLVPALLALGEEVRCEVMLGDAGEKTLTSTVCWAAPLPTEYGSMFKAGLRFGFAASREKDSIVKFVFGEQFKRRTRGRASP